MTISTNILIPLALLAIDCSQRTQTEDRIAQSPDSTHLLQATAAQEGLGRSGKSPGGIQIDSNRRLKLVAHLTDGSQIVGIPKCEAITVRTAYGDLDLPFVDLLTIDFTAGKDSLSLSFRNGDKLRGRLVTDLCQIVTILGDVSLAPKDLVSITIDRHMAGIDNSLIGYYPFNGSANDESGRGNNGTVHRAVLASDRFGNRENAFKFDGTDSYITFTRGWIPPDIDGFTVSVWLYAEEGTRGIAVYTGATMGECQISVDDDGLFFAVDLAPDPSYSNSWFKASAPIITGRFVHVVGVYRRGQTVQLWVNGILAQESPVPMNDLNHGFPTHNASIGSYSPSQFRHMRGIWFGMIDDLRLYGRALSDKEIRSLYENDK